MLYKQQGFSKTDLANFKNAQRIAYECAIDVKKMLKEGMTERQATHLMQEWMAKKNIGTFFHKPFAWFGKRTRF